MCELHPEHVRSAARTAIGYSQAFDGKGIDWQNAQPWPHRIELAQALDWITELGALVLNMADRVESGEAEITRLRAELAASCEREARMLALLQAADVLFAHHCQDCTAWNWLDNTRAALAEGAQG